MLRLKKFQFIALLFCQTQIRYYVEIHSFHHVDLMLLTAKSCHCVSKSNSRSDKTHFCLSIFYKPAKLIKGQGSFFSRYLSRAGWVNLTATKLCARIAEETCQELFYPVACYIWQFSNKRRSAREAHFDFFSEPTVSRALFFPS